MEKASNRVLVALGGVSPEDVMHRRKTFAGFRENKYGARRTRCALHSHRSGLEAKTCMELQLRQKAGDIESFRCEVDIPLIVNGIKLTTYRADFLVQNADGTEEVVEAKGFPNPLGMLKFYLCEAIFKVERPNTKMIMVTK